MWTPRALIAGSGAGTTSLTISGLANGREYRYHVRAVNDAGPGAAAPDAATGYDVNFSSWSNLERWGTLLRDTPPSKWWWMDYFNREKTWTFAVRAKNAHGNSSWTNSLSEKPPPCPPTNVQAQWITGGIEVSWTPGKRTTSYVLAYSIDGGATWTDIGSGITGDEDAGIQSASNSNGDSNDITYEWTGADRSKTYIFSVRPEYHGVEGEWVHAPPTPTALPPHSPAKAVTAQGRAARTAGVWLRAATQAQLSEQIHPIHPHEITAPTSNRRGTIAQGPTSILPIFRMIVLSVRRRFLMTK